MLQVALHGMLFNITCISVTWQVLSNDKGLKYYTGVVDQATFNGVIPQNGKEEEWESCNASVSIL